METSLNTISGEVAMASVGGVEKKIVPRAKILGRKYLMKVEIYFFHTIEYVAEQDNS